MGLFVGGICGWNLLGAYTGGIIGTRSGSWSRKKNPDWSWIATSVTAFIFGLIGVGVFLIGAGAPAIPAFAIGIVTAAGVLVAIVRRRSA